MSSDNHRAPSRLAPPPGLRNFRESASRALPLDHAAAGTRPSPSREPEPDEIVESVIYEEPALAPDTPEEYDLPTEHPNGRAYERQNVGLVRSEMPATPAPRDVMPSTDGANWPPQNPGELSKKERYQLLMHTIQLYDEDWKLASIRSAHGNRMVAYLVPRNRRMDLRTAIDRRRVTVIMLDHLGNTDIKEPPPRTWFQRIFDWLRGS